MTDIIQKARADAAAAVGLSAAERERVAVVNRATEATLAAIETRVDPDPGPLLGTVQADLHVRARDELRELSSQLGEERSRALLSAVYRVYRESWRAVAVSELSPAMFS